MTRDDYYKSVQSFLDDKKKNRTNKTGSGYGALQGGSGLPESLRENISSFLFSKHNRKRKEDLEGEEIEEEEEEEVRLW